MTRLLVSVLILSLINQTLGAQFLPLQSLVQQKFSDELSVIRFANEQKLSIPLNKRYISYSVKNFPENANDCVFKQPTVQYKKLAESSKLFEQDDEIIAALPLKRQQLVILADPYYNIMIYSIDQHKLLRRLSPKTSITPQLLKAQKKMASPVALLTTEEQDFVYYLSPLHSVVFSSKSFGTQIQRLELSLPMIKKGIYCKGYIVILSPDDGIHVYKLNKKTHLIEKMQTILIQNHYLYLDMQLDEKNSLFYFLVDSSIHVYAFKPSKLPNPANEKEFVILLPHDQIDLTKHTRNVSLNSNVIKIPSALQIATTATQTSLFVLLRQQRRNAIAEFAYNANNKQITFLRYYKFQIQIKEIHTIEDVIVVVGEDILGLFPYGIDPRLITEEFNGWMTLSDLQKIIITEAPYFLGITKNSIQFGGLLFNQQVSLDCQLSQASLTKSIIFSANLTWCTKGSMRKYNQYCSYKKTFLIESMDIVTTSIVSSSVWIAIITCMITIIFGILAMFIMYKKKSQEIKKLQRYFEEKKNQKIPATSDRRSETEDRL